SAMASAADVLGKRFAYTTPESQSGYQAPRGFFASLTIGARAPHFAALVGPLITPWNVVQAVLDGDADAGPLDSYAHDLLRRHRPELTSRLRTVASTIPTPIPPFVAAAGTPSPAVTKLRQALLAVAASPELDSVREALQLEGFAAIEAAAYDVLAER